MATGQCASSGFHACSCGERFDTTEELVVHAREDHGLWIH
jgi:hypothetical protein